jgi:flagellar basal body-associated protein FliL
LGREGIKMKLDNSKRKKSIIAILMILIGIAVIAGISYAYMRITKSQKSLNLVNINCLDIEINDVSDAINMQYAYPLTDSEGETTEPYTFTITNKCYVEVDYSLNLDVLDTEDRIESKNIAIKLDNNEKNLLTNYTKIDTTTDMDYKVSETYSLKTGTLKQKETITYNLRLWLDKSAGNETQNGTFQSKVSVTVEQSLTAYYKETALNGADPVISDNLIAVNIANDGTVTKADTTKKWYSYVDKEWANAVILKDESINYDNGATIPEDNIESYFVWIPKYSYRLWDLGDYSSAATISSWAEATESNKQDTINIKFGTINTSDENDNECTTPLTTGVTGNCKVGDYMTHPAFINANTNGLWVGKFETGYDGATSTTEAEVSSQDSTKIIVKPNVYSWRSNNVYNFFMASYNYNRNLDSHMMKNTEWGAVAYLSYSKYGLNDEIWINNNYNYVTGCVGSSVSASSASTCQNTYNTTTGYKGSTTGNITGIYDMSGGAWEYMATYRENTPGSSGFSTTTLSTYAKYLDVYNANSGINTYQFRIFGDATGEMGPFYSVNGSYYNNWFQDYSSFVCSSAPWFERGGGCSGGSAAGQFGFHRGAGDAHVYDGSRLVLAI